MIYTRVYVELNELIRLQLKAGGSVILPGQLVKSSQGEATGFRGRNVVPIEVKYKSLKKQEISRSLRSFIGKYSPDKAYIVKLDYNNTLKINKLI